MNYLLALLAFAALMIVLSTVVTTSVELIHKIFQMRRQGLAEAMRALHDNVIAPLEQGRRPSAEDLKHNGSSPNAVKFADAITKNPAYGGGNRWWWISNWPLQIFQRRFEHLSNHQFAQQLAQTDFGRTLASQNRAVVQVAIKRTVFEFYRYGVAQRQFFRRRAKVLASVVALFFVVVGNINAITIYMHLATHQTAVGSALSSVNVEKLNQLVLDVEAAQDKVETNTAQQDLMAAQGQIAEALLDLTGEDALPMGAAFFPYCVPPNPNPARDPPGCERATGDGTLRSTLNNLSNDWGRTFVWAISMITTAALLGLGAPFWFDVFNRAAQIVARSQGRVQSLFGSEDPRTEGEQEDSGVVNDFDFTSLTDVFLLSAGVEAVIEPGIFTEGHRLGDASENEINRSPSNQEGEAVG